MPNGRSSAPRAASSRRSTSAVAELPMPIMPRPPARDTAAANRPPAAPPMGALTIGASRPIARAQLVTMLTVGDATSLIDSDCQDLAPDEAAPYPDSDKTGLGGL